MNVLLSIIGLIGALVMIAAGFEYVFDPAGAKKLMKTAAMWLGTVLGCLIALAELTGAHPFGFLLTVLMISPVAYVVRERRLRHREHPQKIRPRAMERTPVAPRHVREDEV